MEKLNILEFIKIYEKEYHINKNGKIFNKETKKEKIPTIIKPSKYKNSTQYHILTLRYNKKQYHQYLHRVIAKKFIPNKNNKLHVNHIDGNGLNNNVNNLEWVSPKENQMHWIMSNKVKLKKKIRYEKRLKRFIFKNNDYNKKAEIILKIVNENGGNMAKAGKEIGYTRERIRQILTVENKTEIIRYKQDTYNKIKKLRKSEIFSDYHNC